MANPNEIDFKINMPPGPFEDFKKLVEEFKRLYSASKSALSDSAGAAKEIAEAVRIMDERARSTGSSSVIKAARGSFSEGFGMASKLDANYNKLGRGMDVTAGRVNATEAAVLGGQLDAAQGIQLLKKYTADLNKKRSQQGDLDYAMEATQGDLISASPLDDTLASYARVATEIRDTKNAAAALKRELREQVDLLAEQREELDMNSATYEQEAAELMKREKAYRSLAAAAEKAENDAAASIQKTQEAFAAYDGSAEAMEKISKATADASANQKKLDDQVTKVANDRAMAEQKEAASAEKARNKAEEDAKKAAEREEAARIRAEEKARREEAAAARREQREEEMARRDAERAEKEAYATSLVTMSKQQLYAELQRVNEERQKAAELNDLEALRKLNMQYAVGRSQMERTNNAMRIQRMLYLQQAQAAKRIAESLGEMAEGISTVGEQAEEGELDLVGLATGAMEMYEQFQAGIGGMQLFMMALQAVQDVMNELAKSEKQMAEAESEYRAAYDDRIDVLNDYKDALQDAEDAAAHEATLEGLQDAYKQLNTETDNYVKNLEKAYKTADRIAARAEAEVEHQRQLRIMSLNQMLTAGTITQEQFDREMINLDQDAAIKSVQSRKAAAERKAKKASAKSTLLTTGANFAARKADATQRYAESFVTDAELTEYQKKRKELEDKRDEAFTKAQELLNQPLDTSVAGGWVQIAADYHDWVKDLWGDSYAGSDRSWKTAEEAKRYVIETQQAISNESNAAIRALDDDFGKRTGIGDGEYGVSNAEALQGYVQRRELAIRDADLAKQAAEEARRKAEEAEAAAEAASDAAREEAENADDVTRRASEIAEAKRSGLQVNAMAKAAEKRRAEEIEKLRKDAGKMTKKALEKQIKEAEELASDQTPEGRHYMQKSSILKAEKERRAAVLKEAKKARKDSAEFAEGSAARKNMDWLLGGASKAVKDGTVTEATFRKLIEALALSQRTKSTADDELAKALILQIKKIKDGDAKSLKKLKNVQYELSR